jgi:hypothetical protein
MREQDVVVLAWLVVALPLYAAVALAHLPLLVGAPEDLPPRLQAARRAIGWRVGSGPRAAVTAYIGWSVFTQFVPVVFLLAFLTNAFRSSAILGTVAALEIGGAAAWTAYLVSALRVR